MSELENLLCRIHQQSFCHLVGNATTGLFIAIKSLGLKNKNIAIPNSVCPHVPLAILLSGNNPVYLDITIDDLGIDIVHLEKKINIIDAVIAVHAYGSVCNIRKIASLCKIKGLPLIEDVAVAQGASHDGLPVGSFSDISVVSFGSGKIIDIGHGGAIMTSNPAILNEICRSASMLKSQTEHSKGIAHAFSQLHTDLYNKHYGVDINTHSSDFCSRALKAGWHMICAFEATFERPIIQGLGGLKSEINSRREKFLKFESSLIGKKIENIKIFHPPRGSVYWRLNMFMEQRDILLKKMLSNQMKVSSWFPSVDLFFKERPSISSTPVSDRIGDSILNIWVNGSADDSYINSVVREFKNHAEHKLQRS